MSEKILQYMASTKQGAELANYIAELTASYETLGRPGVEKSVGFDLDKTLIYSEGSMRIPEGSEVPIRLVEFYDRKPLTYMTEASHMMLSIMSEQSNVIPVTARRQDQLERVMLPWGKSPHYVCLSGAVVVANGKEDKDWAHEIRKVINRSSVPLSEIKEIINPFEHEPWVLRRNVFGDMFEVTTLDLPNVPQSFYDHVEEQIQGTGFFWSVQGRKLYLTPSDLSKGEAFKYLLDKLDIKGETYGAGDSLMDLELLKNVDYPFHPLHGEITEQGVAPSNSVQSVAGGVLGGEEIVARVFASVVR